MKEGGAVLLIIVALFLGYLAVSGKYKCLTRMFACIASDDPGACDCAGSGSAPSSSSSKGILDGILDPYKDVPYIFQLAPFQVPQ